MIINDEVLQHHGILGQKWGIRRYQNADGTLTDAGRKRKLGTDGAKIGLGAAAIGAGTAIAAKTRNSIGKTAKTAAEAIAGAPGAVKPVSGGFQNSVISGFGPSILEGTPIQSMAKGGLNAAKSAVLPAALKGGTEVAKGLAAAGGLTTAKAALGMAALAPALKTGLMYMGIRSLISAATIGAIYAGSAIAEKYKNKKIEKDAMTSNKPKVKINKPSDLISHKPSPSDYKSKYNNKYDSNFLESIQNSKILIDGNTKALDDEYDIYKKNPKSYTSTRSNKLDWY